MRGVEQPIKVTQRPGSSRYVVAAGGNSRLGVMQELHQETQLERFAAIPAQFVAYQSELELLVQHIIENEQRYDMSFWDKACALTALAEDMGIADLSLREMSDQLLAEGVVVSYVKLSEFIFATTKLKGLGDYCVHLSSYKTIDLRKVYNDLQKLVVNESAQFDAFWHECMTAYADVLPPNDSASELNITGLVQSVTQNFAQNWPEHQATVLKLKKESKARPIDTTAPVPLPAPSSHPDTAEPLMAAISNQLQQFNEPTLHDCINALLDYVSLGGLFRVNEQLPYEFYLDIPQLDGEFDGEHYPIELIHPEAGDVFYLLVQLSYQTDTTADGFYTIPNESSFKQTFSDTQLWQDLIQDKIGHPTPSIVQSWLMFCEDERFVELVIALFASLRSVRESWRKAS
jgi:hypothetical protein